MPQKHVCVILLVWLLSTMKPTVNLLNINQLNKQTEAPPNGTRSSCLVANHHTAIMFFFFLARLCKLLVSYSRSLSHNIPYGFSIPFIIVPCLLPYYVNNIPLYNYYSIPVLSHYSMTYSMTILLLFHLRFKNPWRFLGFMVDISILAMVINQQTWLGGLKAAHTDPIPSRPLGNSARQREFLRALKEQQLISAWDHLSWWLLIMMVNDRKTLGKPKENGDLMVINPWLMMINDG